MFNENRETFVSSLNTPAPRKKLQEKMFQLVPPCVPAHQALLWSLAEAEIQNGNDFVLEQKLINMEKKKNLGDLLVKIMRYDNLILAVYGFRYQEVPYKVTFNANVASALFSPRTSSLFPGSKLCVEAPLTLYSIPTSGSPPITTGSSNPSLLTTTNGALPASLSKNGVKASGSESDSGNTGKKKI